MNNNNQVRNDNDTRKIFTTLVLVLTLMICTTSATYAYFAISATATNNITGTAATANLQWGTGTNTTSYPNPISPSSTYLSKPMVPQKSLNGTTDILQLAVTGGNPNGSSTKVPCVDDNGNVVCKIYSFTICNDSTAAAKVDGTIQFNWASTDSFTNLKYLFMESATEPGTVSSTTIKSAAEAKNAAATFEDDYLLSADTNTIAGNCAGGNKIYYLIVWIEETETNQNTSDKGTFYATISFNSSAGGGITSTITG